MERPITTYEFEFKNNLNYGGNEGIYLDLWIEYFADGEKRSIRKKRTLRQRHLQSRSFG